MPSNCERAERASMTLTEYRKLAYGVRQGMREPFDTVLTDLISDLLHLCDEHGEDFDLRLEMARMHLSAEQQDD